MHRNIERQRPRLDGFATDSPEQVEVARETARQSGEGIVATFAGDRIRGASQVATSGARQHGVRTWRRIRFAVDDGRCSWPGEG